MGVRRRVRITIKNASANFFSFLIMFSALGADLIKDGIWAEGLLIISLFYVTPVIQLRSRSLLHSEELRLCFCYVTLRRNYAPPKETYKERSEKTIIKCRGGERR